MDNKRPHTVPRFVIVGFFILGLISAVAYRAIVVIQHIEPRWVRPAWYIGTLGYLLFFLYRFSISRKRKHAIKQYQLIEKIKNNACLNDEDREVVVYLLQSLRKSMEDRNYFIIFILSIVAIVVDLIIS
ncbi:MAG TPA: hypothetical protein ENK09_12980 [Nitrospirae bacterium]|nr:hypothetical protein [Nitrospirota bacterium]